MIKELGMLETAKENWQQEDSDKLLLKLAIILWLELDVDEVASLDEI